MGDVVIWENRGWTPGRRVQGNQCELHPICGGESILTPVVG